MSAKIGIIGTGHKHKKSLLAQITELSLKEDVPVGGAVLAPIPPEDVGNIIRTHPDAVQDT